MVGWREGFFVVFWLRGVFSGWQLGFAIGYHVYWNQYFSVIFLPKY
jgi:hypothetical protein